VHAEAKSLAQHWSLRAKHRCRIDAESFARGNKRRAKDDERYDGSSAQVTAKESFAETPYTTPLNVGAKKKKATSPAATPKPANVIGLAESMRTTAAGGAPRATRIPISRFIGPRRAAPIALDISVRYRQSVARRLGTPFQDDGSPIGEPLKNAELSPVPDSWIPAGKCHSGSTEFLDRVLKEHTSTNSFCYLEQLL
jgi:hypothetical protein